MSKVVLITGGSRGIGAASALLAARQGWAVAVNYTSNSLAADEVVRQIRQSGGQAITVQADVADEAQVLAMFEKVDAKLGRLDGLVNNAGVVDRTTRVDAMTLARLRRMFEINVFGSFLCAREAVKRMSTRHGGAGGAIVNLSSAAARLGGPGQYVDYAAAKGAIDTFTVGLAKEVATEGIRVNAISAGPIKTLAASGIGDFRYIMKWNEYNSPLRRNVTIEDVGGAGLYLLSDLASGVTGEIHHVDAGYNVIGMKAEDAPDISTV